MTPDRRRAPPIRRQIVVPTTAADAFRLWTDDLGAWWPFDPHSVYGTGGTVGSSTGSWWSQRRATGIAARGHRGGLGAGVRLTWHPGRPADEATDLEIRFEDVEVAGERGPHALVSVEHRGWERRADGGDARREYEQGWVGVLAGFGEAARRGETWLVLAHTAGPTAPAEGPLFAHADFAEHLAFLGRLADEGVLVAAGPLASMHADPDGARGMTVIRVPEGDVDLVRRSARTKTRAWCGASSRWR